MNIRSFQAATHAPHRLTDIAAEIGAIVRRGAKGSLIGAVAGSLAVGALITNVSAEVTAAEGTGNAFAQQKRAGVFTGQFVNGMPVYQLPSVVVVANRKAELAKIQREELVERTRQARSRAATKPPA